MYVVRFVKTQNELFLYKDKVQIFSNHCMRAEGKLMKLALKIIQRICYNMRVSSHREQDPTFFAHYFKQLVPLRHQQETFHGEKIPLAPRKFLPPD
jgi:hypothetical protein